MNSESWINVPANALAMEPAVPRRHKNVSRTAKMFVRNKRKNLRGDIDAIIFDGDDTLWRTQELYEVAKDQYERVVSRLGIHDRNARTRLDAIDASRVGAIGFSKARFPGSLVQALRLYKGTHGVEVSKSAIARVRKIGNAVFAKHVRVPRGVRSTLRFLRGRYRLLLVTKGDPVVQRRRLKQSGLKQYFDQVHFVDAKSPQILRAILRSEKLIPSRVLVVGDSLRSDIYPAIRVGAWVAWIPASTWRYEQVEIQRTERFIQLTDIRDLISLV
jgi:putative hydrolase of the HAD superfamily